MKTVLKYLGQRLPYVILAMILIAGSVVTELYLPNIMSNIVSIGIQQGGVEDASPYAISKNGYTLATRFMTDSEKALMKECYTLSDPNDKSSPAAKYDLPKDESVYVLNDNVTNEERSKLNEAFCNSDITLYAFAEQMAKQNHENADYSQNTGASDDDSKALDLKMVYQYLPMLDNIPQSEIDTIRENAIKTNSLIAPSIGISFAKSFYQDVGVNTNNMQISYIFMMGGFMLLMAIGSCLCSIFTSLIVARTASNVAMRLRRDIFAKVTNFSGAEMDKFSTASLITRNTNDVTQVQMLFTMGFIMMLRAPFMGAGGIIMALGKSISMSWIIAVSVLVLLGIIGVIMVVAMPKFRMLQSLIDRINLVSRENLNGIMVIRAFNNEEFETNRYDQANTDLSKTQLFVNRVMVIMMPAMMLIMNFTSMLVIWVGAHQIADSTMQIGDMMAFMQYSIQIIISFLMISVMFVIVPRAMVSARRIEEVLLTPDSIKDPATPQHFDGKTKGLLEFRNVCFHYEGAEEDTVKNISFTAKPGQTTAIIGATGSGKSSLINLIPRLYDCTGGEVLLDGVNVKDVTQHELRERIGFVPQKGVLHKGTIRSNIAYGKDDATDEEIFLAAEVAQAMEFISQKPDGFDSEIAAGGNNVSGGQKQRISIARALVKKPEVYVFDDSFSALDFKTDLALRKALKHYTENATVIIVAQRVGTIVEADQILVLDHGEIVGRGTHKELLQSCPVYYEIALSQLNKEELE